MSNLWQIPLPSYLQDHLTSNGISASEGLKNALNEPPRPERFALIVEWVLTIASYLRLLIAITFSRMNDTFIDLIARIDALEAQSLPSESTPHPEASNIAKGWRHVRCSKCHARGHDSTVCRSQNPEAVKRRIASNRKANKRKPPSIPINQYPPYAPAPHMYPPPTTNWSAFMTDANELRRRKTQSNRDKRRTNKNKGKQAA